MAKFAAMALFDASEVLLACFAPVCYHVVVVPIADTECRTVDLEQNHVMQIDRSMRIVGQGSETCWD